MKHKFFYDHGEFVHRLTGKESLDITFQVTDNCNLQCTYCYQQNKQEHMMHFSTIKSFIDNLLKKDPSILQYVDLNNIGGLSIEFIGGEPLLNLDLIEQTIVYIISQLILQKHDWLNTTQFGICSNGTLYFDPKFQAILKKYNAFISFGISLDGNKKLHDSCRVFPNGNGSYELALKAAQDYKIKYKDGEMPGTKMTISPQNIFYISDAIINLINLDYKDIYVNCAFEEGWSYDLAKILYQQLQELGSHILENNLEENIWISMFQEDNFHPMDKNYTDNWCGGNGRMIAIDWKGDIYPCLRYMESSLGSDAPPIIIGNVKKGFMATDEQKKQVKELQAVNRITQSTEECINCPIAQGCSWCQAFNYQDSGGNLNHRATYICPMHKATSLANAYFWNLYYRKHNENKRFKIWLPDEECLKIISQDELKFLHQLEH